jgi:hypothetical protein
LQKFGSPDMRTDIQLQVKEGIDVGHGKPGFRLSLSGWKPGAAFDVYGLDADGTHVELDSGAVDRKGAATVAVPYEASGLHPGAWIIGVTGKDVDRAERLAIPRVTHGRHGWHLDFSGARKQNPAPPAKGGGAGL